MLLKRFLPYSILALNFALNSCKEIEILPEMPVKAPKQTISHAVPRPKADPHLIQEAGAFFVSPQCDSLVKVGFENFKKPLTNDTPMGKVVDGNPGYTDIFKDLPEAIAPHDKVILLDAQKLATTLKDKNIQNCQYQHSADSTKFMTLKAKDIIDLVNDIEKIKQTPKEKETKIYFFPDQFTAVTGRAHSLFSEEKKDKVAIIAGALLALGHLQKDHVVDVITHELAHIPHILKHTTADGQLKEGTWLLPLEVQADSTLYARNELSSRHSSNNVFSAFSQKLTMSNHAEIIQKPVQNFRDAAKLFYKDTNTHPVYHMRTIYERMYKSVTAQAYAENLKFFGVTSAKSARIEANTAAQENTCNIGFGSIFK